MPPGQRQLAERRLLAALRRLHRREPMLPDVRIDAVLDEARDTSQRPASHRGGTPLSLTNGQLVDIIDDLASRAELVREGHRIRLADHAPALGHEMRERADALLAELRRHGARPPRADGVARRLGVPAAVVDSLRRSGELVSLADGIDYPVDVLGPLLEGLRERNLDVAAVRDELGTSRRYAAALLEAARDLRPPR